MWMGIKRDWEGWMGGCNEALSSSTKQEIYFVEQCIVDLLCTRCNPSRGHRDSPHWCLQKHALADADDSFWCNPTCSRDKLCAGQ